MEDYDVKDVMGRIQKPKLSIVGCFLNLPELKYENKKTIDISFFAMIENYGIVLSRDYKLISYFFCSDDKLSTEISTVNYLATKAKSLVISGMCTKISSPSLEAIFPNEKLEIGHTTIKVSLDEKENYLSKAFVVSTLHWEEGREDMLYFCNGNDPIYERDEIAKYIPEELRQYILSDPQKTKD